MTVTEADGSSEHTLSVASSDLDRLASAATDVETLVEESFRFLLEREGRQSILRSFALTDISRYFPEYESQIRQRL